MTGTLMRNVGERFGQLREEVADALDHFADRIRTREDKGTAIEPTRADVRAESTAVAPRGGNALGRFFEDPFALDWPPLFTDEEFNHPRVEIRDEAEDILVLAEVPGYAKEQLDVQVSGDRLVLRGRHGDERKEEKCGTIYSERTMGEFMRSVPLPSIVDREKTRAEYRNGVLTVRLPKTESARSRTVPVAIK